MSDKKGFDSSNQEEHKEKEHSEVQNDDIALAKKKAAAAARAKAEALKKQREAEKKEEDDLELAKKKAAAAARAKAEALKKQREAEKSEEGDLELAKKKAAAAARAKAEALKKQREAGTKEEDIDLAKKKAAAAAKAKAAAQAKARAQAKQKGESRDLDKEKAKAIAAAKAKAAAAAKAKALRAKQDTPEKEETPSKNQPILDKYVKVIKQHFNHEVLEDYYINRLSKDVPTLVVKKEHYYKVAEFLRKNEQLAFNFLSELHGTDFETHMEVYLHLYSYPNDQSVALKVKLDRNEPTIDSVVPLWEGANWPEREAYDLLGITFVGHPNLKRIFLPDDWVGHPLRKDYEQYDVEV